MRRGRASGSLGRRSLPVPSLHSLWGRVSLLGACFSSWGVLWISTLSPRPERRGSCLSSADNTNSVPFRRLFGNRGSGKEPTRRGRKLFGPGNFPARGLRSPHPPWLPPRALPQELRSPSPAESGAGASRTALNKRLRPESPNPASAPARARS